MDKVIFICVAVPVLALVIFARIEWVEHQELEADRCKVVSRIELEERVYCGKACYRPMVQTTYACDSGERVHIR